MHKNQKNPKSDRVNLRQRAEELLKNKPFKPGSQLSEVEVLKLLYELQVHQIELEMQNEELRLAYEREAELAKDKYIELYDFAPSGYYTISKDGEIVDLNFTGAKMLGKERTDLKKNRFGFFVTDDTRADFNGFVEKIFKSRSTELIEVRLVRNDNSLINVILTGTISANGDQFLLAAADISERKLAEEKLRVSEEKWHNLFHILPVGVSIVDDQNMCTECNPALAKILDISNESLLKGDFKNRKYIRPDHTLMDIDEFPSIRSLKKQKTIEDKEIGVVKEDGNIIWTNIYAAPLSDGKSSVTVTVDVTEQKQTLEKLRESEYRYKKLFENSGSGIIIIDKDGKYLWVNKKAAEKFGVSEKEVEGKTIFDFLPFDEAQKYYESNKLAIESGEIREYEDTFILPTGKKTFLIVDQCLQDGSGNNYALQSSSIDITEYKKAEKALKVSEKRYRMMFQHMNAGFALHEMIFDEMGKPCDYRFLEINHAFETLTGLKAHELIGKTTLEVLPETEPYWIKAYGEVALTGKTLNFENYSAELKKYFQVSVYSPEHGKFATTFIDVTESKIADEEKRKLHEIQKQLIKHMTEIRENERAIISREIHDQLGQSMTALKLDLNWLQAKTNEDHDIKEKLSGMVEIVTSTIKNVQRISSELRPGILDDLGLAAAIEWYAEEFEKRTNLLVVLDLDEVQSHDENANLALFRVMQESLTNVIRHAQAKTVHISLQKIDEHIVLDIEDDGIGIPIEKLKSINSLGIFGMNDRIKQARGTIDILSGSDAGTKLRICIPLWEETE